MGFFHDRTRVRLWRREYGAYVRADEGGEIILHRDHGTTLLDEARAAHCFVRDADHYVLFYGAAYDRNLVQIVDGESPVRGGHGTNHAVHWEHEAAFRADEQRQRQATQAPALASNEPATAMEFFPERTHVWLRIREYEAYLYAREDGEEIAISDDDLGAAPLRGTWAVHRLVRDGTDYVLFHSASYGRYPALMEAEAEEGDDDEYDYYLPGKCTNDSPERVNVLFQARRAEDASDDILISNRRFGDWCHRRDDEITPMHWVLEAIPPRLLPPELSVPPEPIPPPEVPVDGPIHLKPELVLRRTIHYVRADDQGNFNKLQWRILEFEGQSVFNLRRDLADELGDANNVLGFKLCVWAGTNGRLIPLVMDLPSNENTIRPHY